MSCMSRLRMWFCVVYVPRSSGPDAIACLRDEVQEAAISVLETAVGAQGGGVLRASSRRKYHHVVVEMTADCRSCRRFV